MASIFSKIVAGEIPSYKIAETENCLAFLDVFPLQEGHTLVIPKKEVNYLFDLPEELYAELMSFSKEVSKAVKKAMPCERIGVAVIGLEVPHAHVHLIPITQMDDMNFANPTLKIEANRMEQIASAIRSEL